MKYVKDAGQLLRMDPKIMTMNVDSSNSDLDFLEIFVEDNTIPLYVGARFTCVVHAIHTKQ